MPSIRHFALAVAAFPVLAAAAAPEFALLFRDHAVLQRGMPVPVWGRAAPGEHVRVSFAGQAVGATAGSDGRWIAVLAPLTESSAGADLTVVGKEAVAIHDVVVGEVWLCSGQSSIEAAVDERDPGGRTEGVPRETAAALHPLIRQFKVLAQSATSPVEIPVGEWSVCTPTTVGRFSAVGYSFARDLFTRLGVPIGIVNCTSGSAPIEAWMSPAAFAALPGLANGLPAAGAGHEDAERRTTSSLFNEMIQPLLPFAIRGVIWYQGESNVGRAPLYAMQFPSLISAWRSHFGEGDLPFFWVQLASHPGAAQGDQWAYLREAQSRALSLPSTGQAVAIDMGEAASAGPAALSEVGRRLALIAKARVYSIPVDYSGPVFSSATAEGPAMRVQFQFAGEGLTASGKPLQSFEVAGPDRVFHPASAIIKGSTVLVRSPAVPLPVAVRYAWRDDPGANLYNGAGLPAAPFRSDNW
jgi:sialate O-acetylesterase